MIKKLISKLDKPLDYEGQELSRIILITIFAIGYSLSFFVGLIMGDLLYTLILGIVTIFMAIIFVVPSWSFYRRNDLKQRFRERKNKVQ